MGPNAVKAHVGNNRIMCPNAFKIGAKKDLKLKLKTNLVEKACSGCVRWGKIVFGERKLIKNLFKRGDELYFGFLMASLGLATSSLPREFTYLVLPFSCNSFNLTQ